MFCVKCGAKNEEDAMFCCNCGEKLQASIKKVTQPDSKKEFTRVTLSEKPETASFAIGLIALIVAIYTIIGLTGGFILSRIVTGEANIIWILIAGGIGFAIGEIKTMLPKLLTEIVTNTKLTVEALSKSGK